MFRLDAVVRWLDAADGRLARHRAEPPATARSPHVRARGSAEGSGRGDERRSSCATSPRSTARAPTRCTRSAASTRRSTPATLVAVMGPSGSGKSTLLTIAGSLEEPTRRRGARRRRRAVGDVAQRTGAAAAPVDRLRVPGLQPAGRPDGGRERDLPLELDGVARAQGARPPGMEALERARPRRPRPIASPTSSRAGSASASRSPARSSASARCCSPTSRRVRSTPSTPRRSCG